MALLEEPPFDYSIVREIRTHKQEATKALRPIHCWEVTQRLVSRQDVVSTVEPQQKGNSMKNTFIILWAPGPAWVPGKTVREQPHWAQHAAFMDRLFENGTVVLGGPFADATGSLVIVEAENEHEVADLFARDPFVVHAIFVRSLLKQWLLFLDARRKA
jgi:uncharacterized protein